MASNSKKTGIARTSTSTKSPSPRNDREGDGRKGKKSVGKVLSPTSSTESGLAASPPKTHVNIVDTALTVHDVEVDEEPLDVMLEEPTYPICEWREAQEPGLVLPDETMADEELLRIVHGRQDNISLRLRREVKDYWIIGTALNLLFQRYGKQLGPDGRPLSSKWRSEWLPRLNVNHTGDQQLRVLAEKFTLEEVMRFGSKTEALQACGFSIGSVSRAIERWKPEENREAKSLPTPTKANVPRQNGQAPHTNTLAAAREPLPPAEPYEPDPIAESEALVVTLEGAKVEELEKTATKAGLTTIARADRRMVGLLWFADADHGSAVKLVNQSLECLKKARNMSTRIEARYLQPTEVIPL